MYLALKDVLEKRGILSEVRAKLRAELYGAFNDQQVPKVMRPFNFIYICMYCTCLQVVLTYLQPTLPKPKLCKQNLLLNELIRDYLEYNKYNYTRSVFLAGRCGLYTNYACF